MPTSKAGHQKDTRGEKATGDPPYPGGSPTPVLREEVLPPSVAQGACGYCCSCHCEIASIYKRMEMVDKKEK